MIAVTTHLLRHGRTEYSARYLVNGDPAVQLQLDEEGVRACHTARPTLPIESARTWIASAFPRAQQTAALLIGEEARLPVVIPLLNELDYGYFEGAPFLEYAAWLRHHGPWVKPPGAGESQREGIHRMLLGLMATLEKPGPRVVVAHGLLLSVLDWHLSRTPGSAMPLFFPEAPYLVPLAIDDGPMAKHAAALLEELDNQDRRHGWAPGHVPISGTDAASTLANVDSPQKPLEE
ncbi:histidine phosphatase family protein [Streptomyces triticirhizae]|uniref:Histidine phosphatase family protein n=1 Tax=Streptomyces triticirhizae TaxID=2483353 RepID=A0A3M2M760_9ACTN|nr:histidine phosphatase family protein [Streptomyces triticirhizae]